MLSSPTWVAVPSALAEARLPHAHLTNNRTSGFTPRGPASPALAGRVAQLRTSQQSSANNSHANAFAFANGTGAADRTWHKRTPAGPPAHATLLYRHAANANEKEVFRLFL